MGAACRGLYPSGFCPVDRRCGRSRRNRSDDLSFHSQQRLNSVASQLNKRPRKVRDYESPAERFDKCVASIGWTHSSKQTWTLSLVAFQWAASISAGHWFFTFPTERETACQMKLSACTVPSEIISFASLPLTSCLIYSLAASGDRTSGQPVYSWSGMLLLIKTCFKKQYWLQILNE